MGVEATGLRVWPFCSSELEGTLRQVKTVSNNSNVLSKRRPKTLSFGRYLDGS